MESKLEIASFVKFHRKKSRLTQLELANIAGVGKTLIFDIEKGKMSIRLDSLLKVLEVLNIQLVLNSKLKELYDEKS